jgi:hypothetical protein
MGGKMNRRAFIAALTGAVLDPERLIWQPGRKTISIPSGGVFGGSYHTRDLKEVLGFPSHSFTFTPNPHVLMGNEEYKKWRLITQILPAEIA